MDGDDSVDYLMTLPKKELVRRIRNYREAAIQRERRAQYLTSRMLSRPTVKLWKTCYACCGSGFTSCDGQGEGRQTAPCRVCKGRGKVERVLCSDPQPDLPE